MIWKLIARGKTYPFREWFRNSGFEWNAGLRQWERNFSSDVEFDQFQQFANGRFDLVKEKAPNGAPLQATPNRGATSKLPLNPDEIPWDIAPIQNPRRNEQAKQHKVSKTIPRIQKNTRSDKSPIRPAAADECIVCGSKIPIARLKAMPGTRVCVVHANSATSNGKRYIKETWGSREDWKKDRGGWRKNH